MLRREAILDARRAPDVSCGIDERFGRGDGGAVLIPVAHRQAESPPDPRTQSTDARARVSRFPALVSRVSDQHQRHRLLLEELPQSRVEHGMRALTREERTLARTDERIEPEGKPLIRIAAREPDTARAKVDREDCARRRVARVRKGGIVAHRSS